MVMMTMSRAETGLVPAIVAVAVGRWKGRVRRLVGKYVGKIVKRESSGWLFENALKMKRSARVCISGKVFRLFLERRKVFLE